MKTVILKLKDGTEVEEDFSDYFFEKVKEYLKENVNLRMDTMLVNNSGSIDIIRKNGKIVQEMKLKV